MTEDDKALIERGKLYDYMLDVANANGFESLTEAITVARSSMTGWIGPHPQRMDLAIPAMRIASRATDLATATGFAATALDFATGTYDPNNFDAE